MTKFFEFDKIFLKSRNILYILQYIQPKGNLDAVSKAEKDIEDAEQENVDLKVFLQTIRKCTDLKELTPAIMNTLIKRVAIFNVWNTK